MEIEKTEDFTSLYIDTTVATGEHSLKDYFWAGCYPLADLEYTLTDFFSQEYTSSDWIYIEDGVIKYDGTNSGAQPDLTFYISIDFPAAAGVSMPIDYTFVTTLSLPTNTAPVF